MPTINPLLAAGGGGSTPLELLGPYTVNFNSSGVTGDGTVLTTLAAGQLLVEAYCDLVTQFDNATSLHVRIAPAADHTDYSDLAAFAAQVPNYATSAYRSWQADTSLDTTGSGATVLAASVLMAEINVVSTSGQAHNYALVNTP